MKMINSIVVAASLFTCAAWAQDPLPTFLTEENGFERNCNGQFWHVQGIAISDNAIYCGILKNILKFDLTTGKCVKAIRSVEHTGDLCLYKGHIYTSTFTNFKAAEKNLNDGRGLIQVYDEDLNLIKEKELPFGLDGITVLDNIMYVGRGIIGYTPRRKCSVARLNADTLELIDEIEIESGFDFRSGVQDMASDGKNLFFSFYQIKDKTGVAVFTKDLKTVKTIPDSYPEGLDRLPNRFQDSDSKTTFFGILRKFNRKNAQGKTVHNYAHYLQIMKWDGEKMSDITPDAVKEMRKRPATQAPVKIKP